MARQRRAQLPWRKKRKSSAPPGSRTRISSLGGINHTARPTALHDRLPQNQLLLLHAPSSLVLSTLARESVLKLSRRTDYHLFLHRCSPLIQRLTKIANGPDCARELTCHHGSTKLASKDMKSSSIDKMIIIRAFLQSFSRSGAPSTNTAKSPDPTRHKDKKKLLIYHLTIYNIA